MNADQKRNVMPRRTCTHIQITGLLVVPVAFNCREFGPMVHSDLFREPKLLLYISFGVAPKQPPQ